MDVTFLGTSGGIPIPNRAQSGILIEGAQKKILLDCGMGVPLRLAEAGVQAEDIDVICLTHEHLDHIQDLPSLSKASWLRVRDAEYKIITPPQLPKVLKKFWRSVDEYKRSELDFQVLKPGEEMELIGEIRAFKTDHTDMSQGYKVSVEGKDIVYTGDTAPVSEVSDISESADLLIHELSHLKKTEGHTDPKGFTSTFSGIEVDVCIVTHFYPEIERSIKKTTAEMEKDIGVSITPASDLMSVSL